MNRPSTKRRITKRAATPIDAMQPLSALRQAAKNALQLARDTGTSLVIWKDGKIVDLNARRKKRPARRAK